MREKNQGPEGRKAATGPAVTRAPWAPLVFVGALLAVSLVPRVLGTAELARAFWVSAGALLVWYALVFARSASASPSGTLTLSAPRPQHYVQAMVHFSVYSYWGYYWAPVVDYAWLLLAQFFFAYAFGMLLSWSRGKSYELGFGPFPIIFSTNLFLWFRDEWFAFQFLLIAVAFWAKETIKWERDGKRVHIFNPSAFPLAVASIALILTGTTHITWGPEIASTLGTGPHIYKVLFAGGLVVMFFFQITLLAGCAAATIFGLSALFHAITGVTYFLDTEIPTAVFLGLHLLVTDPSTSPRSPAGKAIFGVLYGVGVFALYSILSAFGAPTFYDKLLTVPLLNLSVRAIERRVKTLPFPPRLAYWGTWPIPRRANLVHMSVWIIFFALMTVTGRTDGMHEGDSVPFWQQACAEGRPTACKRLLQLERSYCADNSGWACNELGIHTAEGKLVAADPEAARIHFAKACEGRFQAGCINLLASNATLARAAPRALDLRLMLRARGPNLIDMPERDLYARACEQRWAFACSATATAP